MRPFLLFLTGLISQQINGTTSQQAESLSYNDTVSQSSTATSQDLTANIDFRTAVRLMLENNNAIKAAEKNTELARRQSQLINASWFPTITMTGTYAMMSNKISVNQEYAPLLDPLKEKYADDFLVPNVLNFISKELGDLSFDVPVIDDDFGSIDLEVIYPLFTGVKRIYANRRFVSFKILAACENKIFTLMKLYFDKIIYFFHLFTSFTHSSEKIGSSTSITLSAIE